MADGNTAFETQRASVLEVVLIAFVERDDECHLPADGDQTKETNGIVGCVQRGGLDRQAEEFAAAVESDQAVDGVVTVAVSHRDDQGELTAMAEAVGGQFVEAVTIDPAVATTVPAPQSQGVAISAVAVTAFFRLLAPIVAVAELPTVWVGPGRKLAAIASGVEVVQVDEFEFYRAGDEAGVEDRLEYPLPHGKSREVTISLQNGSQRGDEVVAGQNAVRQPVDDVPVRTQIVLVLVLSSLVSLVATVVWMPQDGAGLAWTLQHTVLEVVECADTGYVLWVKAA
jgi:hypothetical protein